MAFLFNLFVNNVAAYRINNVLDQTQWVVVYPLTLHGVRRWSKNPVLAEKSFWDGCFAAFVSIWCLKYWCDANSKMEELPCYILESCPCAKYGNFQDGGSKMVAPRAKNHVACLHGLQTVH